MKTLPTIKNLIIRSQRVFLRADLNVPMNKGTISDDYRLQQIIPTINYIQQKGGKVILATHIGSPNSNTRTHYFDSEYSTEPLAEWLEDHGYSVFHEPDLLAAQQHSITNANAILLLENLRFFNGEQGTVQERYTFATLLATLADEYVNDAFGLIHRNDTSVTLLTEQFLPQNRSIGLLVEKEIKHLTKIKQNPNQPFILILGGKKVADKMALLENFITTQPPNRVSAFIIGGLISVYFLQAQQPSIAFLIPDQKAIKLANNIITLASQYNVQLHVPIDLLVQTPDGNTTLVTIANITPNATIIDIGPKTVELYATIIDQAKTIFLNGTMGRYEDPVAQLGTQGVLRSIAKTTAYKVAGGGDAIASIRFFGFENNFDFLSTGGGASLALLSADSYDQFPALKAI